MYVIIYSVLTTYPVLLRVLCLASIVTYIEVDTIVSNTHVEINAHSLKKAICRNKHSLTPADMPIPETAHRDSEIASYFIICLPLGLLRLHEVLSQKGFPNQETGCVSAILGPSVDFETHDFTGSPGRRAHVLAVIQIRALPRRSLLFLGVRSPASKVYKSSISPYDMGRKLISS